MYKIYKNYPEAHERTLSLPVGHSYERNTLLNIQIWTLVFFNVSSVHKKGIEALWAKKGYFLLFRVSLYIQK